MIPIPNEKYILILDDPVFDSNVDWGTVEPLKVGDSILRLCRENHIALADLLRKFRELSEREQYWTTGPNGQGGITEAFAKRLYDFMKAEEGKFPLLLTLQCSAGGECAELEFEVELYRLVLLWRNAVYCL